MNLKIILAIFLPVFLLSVESTAQTIPANSVIPIDHLKDYLKESIRKEIKETDNRALAAYFRQKFSERFFYDYQTFYDRLPHYNALYKNSEDHKRRGLDHLGKYSDSTQWVLPFNYLNGEPVNAYALRHLARQHKMVDIAFYYFNEDKQPENIQYFTKQMRSLNAALAANAYETIEDGNGVYEAFRSGYRVLNWLWIHNMFLNEAAYTVDDQLTTIATLLQHGQHLYERNAAFKSGNHQTRGVSALAMLAILLRDFEGTDLWMERAMLRLGEHLDKEINPDGFQFERSVHYHMSDINNYFYVYQLAKLNEIKVDKTWESKLRRLFTTLIKVAYPDRSAPVLQDDTEIPWAETNDISEAMTLGYLLFEDPAFGYFASDKVDNRVYWFLSNRQIKLLENISEKQPAYGSLSFEDTGYFVMREGWEENDKMMIVSAGLDDLKPDHQHGDMLGIQAMANGHAILPNYQVRYSLKDFDLFKNSMVKNVALVDDELQGKKWTSNKGGSGFGKFRQLPHPTVTAWDSNNNFDFFAGSHDGFEDIGVEYSRQVIFVKDEFWIVKDNFRSAGVHDYKQVWQGHYTDEHGSDLLRSVAPDATGHDILQLHPTDATFKEGARGKEWNVVTKSKQTNFNFITVIYPYRKYHNRLDETLAFIGGKQAKEMRINDWAVNASEWEMAGRDATSLCSDQGVFVFGITEVTGEGWTVKSDEETDLFIREEGDQLFVHAIGREEHVVRFVLENTGKEMRKELGVGEVWVLDLDL